MTVRRKKSNSKSSGKAKKGCGRRKGVEKKASATDNAGADKPNKAGKTDGSGRRTGVEKKPSSTDIAGADKSKHAGKTDGSGRKKSVEKKASVTDNAGADNSKVVLKTEGSGRRKKASSPKKPDKAGSDKSNEAGKNGKKRKDDDAKKGKTKDSVEHDDSPMPPEAKAGEKKKSDKEPDKAKQAKQKGNNSKSSGVVKKSSGRIGRKASSTDIGGADKSKRTGKTEGSGRRKKASSPKKPDKAGSDKSNEAGKNGKKQKDDNCKKGKTKDSVEHSDPPMPPEAKAGEGKKSDRESEQGKLLFNLRRGGSNSKISGNNPPGSGRRNVVGKKASSADMTTDKSNEKPGTKRKNVFGKKGAGKEFGGTPDPPLPPEGRASDTKVSEKELDGAQQGTPVPPNIPSHRRRMLFGKKSKDFLAVGGQDAGSTGDPKESDRENVQDPMNNNLAKDGAMAPLVKKLIEHNWYHGVMPRDEINLMLLKDGDFLVRKTTEKNKPFICLSVKHGSDCRHFPLLYENNVWFVKNLVSNRSFYELVELLDFLIAEKQPLGESNAVLVRAVSRPDYYILNEDIQLICKLGSGAFGEVWKGTLRRSESGTRITVDVAVKKMKGNPTKAITSEFVKEAKLMRPLRHKNIVRVFGVAPNEEPLMIVLELAANGDLKSYVQKNQCPTEELMQFASDAARGMAYLSSKLIIHRDLAARNLLLGSKLEVKISDFGLSEAGKREVKVNKMKLPIRWLAPETIDTGVFTTKTDVWSFGVTLWEIFGRCSSDPFPGLNNQQAKERIRKINPPMQAPSETPSVVVRLLLDCFERNPDARPTFQQILKKFCPNEDVTVYDVEEQGTQGDKSNSLNGSKTDQKRATTPNQESGRNKTSAKPMIKMLSNSTRVLKLSVVPSVTPPLPPPEEQLTQPVSHSLAPKQDFFPKPNAVSPPNRPTTPVNMKPAKGKNGKY